jgi:hypothetical protein
MSKPVIDSYVDIYYIKKLKQGELFLAVTHVRIGPDEKTTHPARNDLYCKVGKTVWVRGPYDRLEKGYMCYKYEDINASKILRSYDHCTTSFIY